MWSLMVLGIDLASARCIATTAAPPRQRRRALLAAGALAVVVPLSLALLLSQTVAGRPAAGVVLGYVAVAIGVALVRGMQLLPCLYAAWAMLEMVLELVAGLALCWALHSVLEDAQGHIRPSSRWLWAVSVSICAISCCSVLLQVLILWALCRGPSAAAAKARRPCWRRRPPGRHDGDEAEALEVELTDALRPRTGEASEAELSLERSVVAAKDKDSGHWRSLIKACALSAYAIVLLACSLCFTWFQIYTPGIVYSNDMPSPTCTGGAGTLVTTFGWPLRPSTLVQSLWEHCTWHCGVNRGPPFRKRACLRAGRKRGVSTLDFPGRGCRSMLVVADLDESSPRRSEQPVRSVP